MEYTKPIFLLWKLTNSLIIEFHGRTFYTDNFLINFFNLLLTVQQSHSVWLLKTTVRPRYWVTFDSFLHFAFYPMWRVGLCFIWYRSWLLIRLCILKFILQLKFHGTARIACFYQGILCKLLIFQYFCHHYS